MINRIEQISIVNPNIVFLMAGINDISECSTEEFADSYCKLVDMILSIDSKPDLIIQSLLPVNENAFNHISCTNDQICSVNRLLHKLANEKGVRFIDLYSQYQQNNELPSDISKDGIHLLTHSYDKWYSVIRELNH